MNRYQLILKWLLLVSGFFLMTAFSAVFLPSSWMATAHERLQLGEFPRAPITLYLARSTSLLYGVHGVLMFAIAHKIEFYWPLVPLFAWLHILIGAVMFVVDISASMPIYWICLEGPPVTSLGVLILRLARVAGPFEIRKDETE